MESCLRVWAVKSDRSGAAVCLLGQGSRGENGAHSQSYPWGSHAIEDIRH